MRTFLCLLSVFFFSASYTIFTREKRCLKQQLKNTSIFVNPPPTSKIVSTKERRRKKKNHKQEFHIDRVPLNNFQRAPLPVVPFDFVFSEYLQRVPPRTKGIHQLRSLF